MTTQEMNKQLRPVSEVTGLTVPGPSVCLSRVSQLHCSGLNEVAHPGWVRLLISRQPGSKERESKPKPASLFYFCSSKPQAY